MFCPECGTLSFPSQSGVITCINFKCGYTGPAKSKIEMHGKEIDLSELKSSLKQKEEYQRKDTSGADKPEWDWDSDGRLPPQRPTCEHCGSSNLKVSGSDGIIQCLDCKKFS